MRDDSEVSDRRDLLRACTRVDLHSIDVLRIYNLREDAYSGFSVNITIKAEGWAPP